MSHSATIPIPQTAFARAIFTRETVESLSKTAWAIILGRYAGSDTVTLEEHAEHDSDIDPIIHHLDVNSSRQLAALVQQVSQISGSSYSKLHAAGGSIADNASHILLGIKDHSRGVSIWKDDADIFDSEDLDSHVIACTVTVEGKVLREHHHTSRHQETTHLVNVHVETVGSPSSNQKHLRRVAIHFQNVLRTLIAKSNDKSESALKVPLSRCFEITPDEIDEIATWNQAAATPHYGPIHYIIEQQAIQRPDAPAIDAWDGQLSYAQLWQESSKLAQQLVSRGIVLETLVPFCFEKSAWAIVTMLGILKAGGAFVPLDPSWPRSRLEHIVTKSQANLIVTSPKMASVCRGLVEDLLVLDGFNQESELEVVPEVEVSSDNLAYVLFTSGTTGQPKGALIEHENLSTSTIGIGGFAHMGPETRIFQFTSYGFDAIFIETMAVLVHGGCICVPADSERLDDPIHGIQRMDVNTIFFTPSFLSTMRPEALIETTKVHTVITGGENLPVHMMETWKRDFHFVNAYGPTECCIATVMSNVTKSTPAQGRIGRAISGKTWIVDHENDDVLAPTGAVGELLLQGPAVGRGYLDDAKKTAEAWTDTSCFSWGHLSNTTGSERIYRTGDLVRYNAQGEIFYIGRKDTQVKLHGQRIELGEIEYHLRQHLSSPLQVIAEMITRDGPEEGSKVIAALLWTTDDPIRDLSDLQTNQGQVNSLSHLGQFVAELDQKLSKTLPRYMVPSVYIPVPHVPLTSSGKLDRRALRTFAESSHAQSFKMSAQSQSTSSYLSEMELELSHLWSKFLSLPSDRSLSPEDSFFHLGGNSIIAIKMVAAGRQANLSLRVQDIFKAPTLSKMASLTTRLDHTSNSASFSQPLEPFSLIDADHDSLIMEAAKQCNVDAHIIEDILPCTPAQQFYMDSTTYFTYARERSPIGLADHFVYHIRPDVDPWNLRAAWDQVSLEHAILRTRLILNPADGKMYQVLVHENEAEPVTWRHVFNTDLDEYLAYDKRNHFGFGQRLVRLALIHSTTCRFNDEGEHIGFDKVAHLVLSIQHAICDAWMMRLLFEEVERYMRDAPTYRGTQILQGGADQPAAKFWKEHLAGAVVKPFPRPPSTTAETGSSVPPASQHELNTIFTKTIHLSQSSPANGSAGSSSAQNGITISTAIYGALGLLMGIYTSAPDVILHLTRSGRDIALPGVENIIAPTMTRHPLRIRVGDTDKQDDDNRTVGDFFHAIQNDLSTMVEYQFTGWSEIQRLLGTDAEEDVNGLLGCRSSYLVNLVPLDDEEAEHDHTGYRSNGRGEGQKLRKQSIHALISEGTFMPMPAGFYTSFGVSADGRTIIATVRYDNRVFRVGGVEKLLGGFEAVLGALLGVAPLPASNVVGSGDDLGGVKGRGEVTAAVEEGENRQGLGERLVDVKMWISGKSGPMGPRLVLPSEKELYC
ncbi:hypothetical protein QBC37DRAFT_448649 [Rhypophila decipiens]|uniref:Carrier domain-containing protein n=1 Tax=Rhypophila decipiens TaxID=261697 RepID=A0AAN7B6T0_9PEZI|nr:hypothetical protein QBC37DRAFT_448649 [Rhypophila decipiens]